MVAPVVHPFTQSVYDSLPEALRTGQEALDYPLLRYLSLLLDQTGVHADAAVAFDYVPLDEGGVAGDTSALIDPDTADAAWLSWLAQLTGQRLSPLLTETARRDAVRYGAAGWRAGTKQAVADAAKSALTGTRYVGVWDHSNPTSGYGAGGEWDVLLVTRVEETPDVPAVLQAVIDKGAKPAGVVLHHAAYSGTWAQIEAAHPTWADMDAATWRGVEESGI